MADKVYAKEKTLFAIASAISVLVWGGLAYYTSGKILLIIPVLYILYIFAQSAFISYLKGTGAVVTDQQFPDLQKRVKFCAEKVSLGVTPHVYILHGNGVFNAYATKFLRTHYIVLLSDVLDALEDHPESINFYIGHEMGHIDRKHLLVAPFLTFALILPILGAAYSRSREYTCDMYGALCCSSEDAQRGLVALGVGGKRYKTINMPAYLDQTRATSGFWMSFHELISSYPWLIKRVARVAPDGGINLPKRNVFAYIPALFIPRASIVTLSIIYIAFVAGEMMKSDDPFGIKNHKKPAEVHFDPAAEFGIEPEKVSP